MVDMSMLGYEVLVDGTRVGGPETTPLASITVEQSIRLPDSFTLEFPDDGFAIFDSGVIDIGSKVEISLDGGQDVTPVTVGEVTSISHDGSTLVAQGFDPAHRLQRGPRTATFIQVTDSDIATKIARNHSLTADVDATRQVHDYVLQYNQSDYEFLLNRAGRIGYDLWVSDDTLHFKQKVESESNVRLRWKEDLLEVRVRGSSVERSDEVVVTGWNSLQKEMVEGRSTDRDTGTTAGISDEVASRARSAFGEVTRTMATRPVASQSEADEMARSLALLASGGEVVVRGVSRGDALLRAGGKVELEGLGQRLSGEYFVTEVTHTINQRNGFRSRFVAGPKDSAGLTDLLGRGASVAAGPGAIFGKVTDNADPEKTGRVKVEFGHLAGTETSWAPLVGPGAGEQRGVQFIPEIGDQVVVVFEQNDIARPIVIGGLWNGKDAPPDDAAASGGKVTRRVIQSREGHNLLFDDDVPGIVELGLGDGSCSLHLEGSESLLKGDQKLVVQGNEVEIVAAGKLVLKGSQVEIEASADVTVSGAIIRLN